MLASFPSRSLSRSRHLRAYVGVPRAGSAYLGILGRLSPYGLLTGAEETKKRFGVAKAIANFPSSLTKQEEANVRVVLEYMQIAYSPTEAGAAAVAHLCAKGNTFLAPSTFPEAHTAEEYADAHSRVMSSLTDLHIVQFDVVVAKENFVSLRYTATGSHAGAPHNGIAATGRTAQWTAAGNFVLDEQSGRIAHWWKDWDKMQMWKQLGWVRPDNDAVEFA